LKLSQLILRLAYLLGLLAVLAANAPLPYILATDFRNAEYPAQTPNHSFMTLLFQHPFLMAYFAATGLLILALIAELFAPQRLWFVSKCASIIQFILTAVMLFAWKISAHEVPGYFDYSEKYGSLEEFWAMVTNTTFLLLNIGLIVKFATSTKAFGLKRER
jgi:hypothetical protein